VKSEWLSAKTRPTHPFAGATGAYQPEKDAKCGSIRSFDTGIPEFGNEYYGMKKFRPF
jgi:hypothetical protein